MCGWLSAEMARASRSKRWRSSGVCRRGAAGRTLTATVRFEARVRRAVDLAHAAGAHGASAISYGPRRVPATRVTVQ